MVKLSNRFAFIFATGFYTGLWPLKGPATFASLVSAVIFFFLSNLLSNDLYLSILIILFTILGIWSSNRTATSKDKDPSKVVIDEWVGMWITLLFLPVNIVWFMIGFLVFRYLDIFKPFGIRKIERFSGGVGIMLDDVAAGFLGCIVLNAINLLVR
ncbi:MAG: phosphatidylglycerophosphatase A [Chloroflexi bacterium]|nr:phosphatidylglycerophosphatase A [Chloroflexota bacterium]|tara:strand:- start:319 stop:786 length:468 start_codon:yes stop_codon:yes gene_type:complete